MEPTISIPKGWQYPRFGFGQRTERGAIIGLKYYAKDTYLADEYGAGWRYILLANKHTEDEEHRAEDEIRLLTPQELKTQIEIQISNHLYQIQSLKQELDAMTASVVIPRSSAETKLQDQTQQPYSLPLPPLHQLVDAAKFIIKEIAKHPDYLALDYQPDLTIGDAQTALSYLQLELETNQQTDTTSNISVQS
ncbi:hypothetical protein I8752_08470 [Nostocaceae cyanobacterium CENA369]|uniref:Uncharacterized protein n=1 Tax=Dendronalium phyllosphericum CENA369 TaxID=1725256 RepID=A0A8J7I7J5_9NOST|nr:hypothetical protein [Dendronalium phyllosphericum]MBH8573047.1 hypothetical protein [Dendronalium phyllosphericum CENA369]